MCLIAPITGLLCFVVSCQPNKKNTFSKDVRNEIPVNSQGIPLYLVSYYDICLLILMCYCLTINASLMFLLEFSVLFLCQSWVVLDDSGWVLTRGWEQGQRQLVLQMSPLSPTQYRLCHSGVHLSWNYSLMLELTPSIAGWCLLPFS